MTTPTFQIPFERRPGTDMTTKNLLKHPEVKDIVTKAVADVDGDAYIIGDSEWADDTQSDELYAPNDESLGHAPIIVGAQHSVNFAFVNRSTRYCILAYQRFKTLSVLVVFCINATSGVPIKLLSSSTLPCAMDVHCDLWARKCHIINHSSAKKWIGATLHPFTALSLLLVDQETCLFESQGWRFHDGQIVRNLATNLGKIIGSRNSIVGCSQINLRCQHQSLSRNVEYQRAASLLICDRSACTTRD